MRIIHKGFSYSHGLEIDGSLTIDSAPGAEKVSNGSFTGAATGWTLTAGWAYSSNTVVKNGDGTTTLAQNVSAIANEIYKLVFTISGWSVGTVTPTLGGVAGTARGANGTYTEYIVATGTGNLIFTPSNTARFTIDTVSVKRVGTVAADRVVAWEDDRGATGGKGSLFLRSEDGTVMVLGPELLINATAAYGRNTQRLEVNVSADEGGAALNTWSATAAEAAMLDFNRSKSATIGAQTVVASDDALGFISFRGSDGTAFIAAAQIRGEVDGTPGTNDMPGRLLFYTTADGAASLSERLRINNAGRFGFNTTDIEAWAVAYTTVFQMGTTASIASAANEIDIYQNLFFDGSSKYRATGTASGFQQTSTGINLLLAPSGTADAALAWEGRADLAITGDTQLLRLQQVMPITGAVADGYAAALRLDPGYTAATAQTVTRHNYIDVQNVSVAGDGPAAVTDACLLRFDAALGTHLATTNTDKSGNTASGTIKVNVNGTLFHIQLYANA